MGSETYASRARSQSWAADALSVISCDHRRHGPFVWGSLRIPDRSRGTPDELFRRVCICSDYSLVATYIDLQDSEHTVGSDCFYRHVLISELSIICSPSCLALSTTMTTKTYVHTVLNAKKHSLSSAVRPLKRHDLRRPQALHFYLLHSHPSFAASSAQFSYHTPSTST